MTGLCESSFKNIFTLLLIRRRGGLVSKLASMATSVVIYLASKIMLSKESQIFVNAQQSVIHNFRFETPELLRNLFDFPIAYHSMVDITINVSEQYWPMKICGIKYLHNFWIILKKLAPSNEDFAVLFTTKLKECQQQGILNALGFNFHVCYPIYPFIFEPLSYLWLRMFSGLSLFLCHSTNNTSANSLTVDLSIGE